MSGLTAHDSTHSDEMGDLWTLKKGPQRLRCSLWSGPSGWELKLMTSGHLVRSHVCPTQTEVFDTAERWKVEAGQKGWKS